MKTSSINGLRTLAATVAVVLAACGGGADPLAGEGTPPTPPPTSQPPPSPEQPFVGAVYAGTNDPGPGGNTVVGFGRLPSGKLVALDAYETGGVGRAGPTPPRLNSLISEDSIIAVEGRFLLVVNAGSNDVTAFRINPDFTLTRTDIEASGGTSPISLAYRNGVVYVANADEDGVFGGPPGQSGNITTMRIDLSTGELSALPGMSVSLLARPADLEITPDGYYLVVSSLNAGSALLPSPTAAEISTFLIKNDGTLAATPSGTGQSTQVGDAAGRNLPNAIGIETFAWEGRQFVIAAEARTASPSGMPPASLAEIQTGSVSTWEINADGTLLPRSQDFLLGPSMNSGPLQPGFLAYSGDYSAFWVSSSAGATIHGYGLGDDGTVARGERVGSGTPADVTSDTPFANADGFVDLVISPDRRWLYQLVGLKGRIDVYEIDESVAFNIALRQSVSTELLPTDNLQGLVAVGPAT
ncbi:MAG TPA: hypothetical protein VMT29_15870 [Steroidobacteraceae bacterium]|nr:hypothetical protein [Steroidobacteraceae bacterium]